MEDCLCRIVADSHTFFLVTKAKDDGRDGFDVTLCDGEQVWTATVSKEEVVRMAKGVDMNVDEYVEQSIMALTCQQPSNKINFVYSTKEEGQNLEFSWKKKLGDGVKFQLGSVTLKKEPNSCKLVVEIISLAVDQIKQHKEEISSLKSENSRLSNERKIALKLLEKCTAAKDEMEKDLFQKFAAVLNEKKAKIRQLQCQVSDYAKDITDRGQVKKKPQKRLLSEGDSTGIRTPSPTPSDDVMANEGPSNTISPNLLLDNDEEEPMEMNVKRRKRRGPKKETPKSKLVLPKVPPVKKTASSSSEDSLSTPRQLRKRTSEKPSPDPDDLMAEMGL